MEMVDETICRGLKGLKKLRSPEFFETWMTRIRINLCKKQLRHRKREVLVTEIPETPTVVYDGLPLRQAVQKLPDDLKVVIILRFFGDYTLKDTAELLDIPQGTVVTRQRKALELLKLDLTEDV